MTRRRDMWPLKTREIKMQALTFFLKFHLTLSMRQLVCMAIAASLSFSRCFSVSLNKKQQLANSNQTNQQNWNTGATKSLTVSENLKAVLYSCCLVSQALNSHSADLLLAFVSICWPWSSSLAILTVCEVELTWGEHSKCQRHLGAVTASCARTLPFWFANFNYSIY